VGNINIVSPNDHVNRSQSTNDAYPTAIHIGMYYTHLKLVKHFKEVIDAFRRKGEEFAHVIKMGRTQLEDAVPMTLGQTFNGFASILQDEVKNLDFAAQDFLTVNMGATAIGTGITAEPEYASKCIAALRKITGLDIRLADDLIGATSDTSCLVGYSSARIQFHLGRFTTHSYTKVVTYYFIVNLIHHFGNNRIDLRTLWIDGITANEEKCRKDVHNSIGVVTALNPVIGYKNSTKIAKENYTSYS